MPPMHAERQIDSAHRPMPGGPGASLSAILAKARRSLSAPKTKAQAQRRAGLYDRVAERSGNGPASRIARLEADRQRGFADTGKYGRGNTPGRADEEKNRLNKPATNPPKPPRGNVGQSPAQGDVQRRFEAQPRATLEDRRRRYEQTGVVPPTRFGTRYAEGSAQDRRNAGKSRTEHAQNEERRAQARRIEASRAGQGSLKTAPRDRAPMSLADADKEHTLASRRAAVAEEAYAANRRGGMKAANHANRTGDRKPLDAITGGRALIDREREEALAALRAARAKRDAAVESARIASLGTPEQVRARADRVMTDRLAQLDAGIKAKKTEYATRQAAKERDRRALDVGPAIGDDPSGDRKRRKPPVSPVRKSTLNAVLRKARRAEPEMVAKSFTFAFTKFEKTGRYVAGWASVVEVNGNPVVDHQGDLIEMEELRKSAHDFVTNARAAKAMHDGDPIGDVVESVLIDDDFAKAHGITHGKRGWWIGMDIRDPSTQARIRKGELKAFSIGGSGRRTPIA